MLSQQKIIDSNYHLPQEKEKTIKYEGELKSKI